MENMMNYEDYDIFAEEYCKQAIGRIRNAMEKKNISQGMLASRSGLGQSTISKFLAGDTRVSLIHIAKICKALEINPGDVLSLDVDGGSGAICSKENDFENDMLIYHPEHPAFKGHLGEFNVYFNSTISSENDILKGTLRFEKSVDGKECLADLILDTGKKNINGAKVTKHYSGKLVISLSLSACYCILVDKKIGEMCFFVFHHMFLFAQELICRLACAVTVSSGGNRYPTMHRMLISLKELDVSNPKSEDFKFIRGQLKLNSSDIIIKKSSYEKLKINEADYLQSNEMRELLDEFDQQRELEEFYCIDEAKIRKFPCSMKEKVQLISLLREYSINEKYNKISTKADEHVYNYFASKKLI